MNIDMETIRRVLAALVIALLIAYVATPVVKTSPSR